MITDLGRVADRKGTYILDLWSRDRYRAIERASDRVKGIRLTKNLNALQTPLEIDGSIISITQSNDSIYGHFLIEVLPRLSLARQAALDVMFLYAGLGNEAYRSALMIAGAGHLTWVDSAEYPVISPKQALIPLYRLGAQGAWDGVKEVYHEIASACGHPVISAERLFVVRDEKYGRAPENQDEMAAKLEKLGFLAVQPEAYSFAEQVAMFREARVVVGVHGSAMFNAVFCRPGAHVLDLMPRCINPMLMAALGPMNVHYSIHRTLTGSSVVWSKQSGIEQLDVAGIYALAEQICYKSGG